VRAGLETVEYLGGDSLLACRVGEHPIAVRVAGSVGLVPGDAAWLAFAPGARHYFNAAGMRAPVPASRPTETRVA
jgi:sn-glycerol 3-phosphate transport system ATP-binding protein